MNERRPTAANAAEAGATAEERNTGMDPKEESRIAGEIRQEARQGAIDAIRYSIAAEATPEPKPEATTARCYLRGAPIVIPTAASLLRSVRRAKTGDEAARRDGDSP